MSIKQKLLEALDITFDSLSTDRLVDILVDAYRAKDHRIKELEGENAHEREVLHSEHELVRREIHRMRSDPLYGTAGEFFFYSGGNKYIVKIEGFHISLLERRNGVDYLCTQLNRTEFQAL